MELFFTYIYSYLLDPMSSSNPPTIILMIMIIHNAEYLMTSSLNTWSFCLYTFTL